MKLFAVFYKKTVLFNYIVLHIQEISSNVKAKLVTLKTLPYVKTIAYRSLKKML